VSCPLSPRTSRRLLGRLFSSPAGAARFFLARRDPLEDFLAPLPEEEAFLLGWLIQFDQSLVPAVQEVQAAFSRLEWIVPQPSYFLHISLGGVAFGLRRPTGQEIASALERARRVWARGSGFEVAYRR